MIAIIGGGALGLLLATKLEKNNIAYKIFNKGKIGRKILASGNANYKSIYATRTITIKVK